MPNSPRMNWPYPAEDQDPWFDTFQTMIQEQDASAFASLEDHNLVMGRGGTVSFTASGGLLSWSQDLEIYSTFAGNMISIPAGSVILEEDGDLFYVTVTRSPRDTLEVTPVVASQAPIDDNTYVIGIRRNDAVYFRFGSKIGDGESIDIFAGGGGGGVNTDTYERHATFGIPDGSSTTVEATVGRIVFPGSIIALSAELTEPVTAGSITVNVKVGGATALSVVLNTTYPSSAQVTAPSGTHPVVGNDALTIEVVPAGYTNASGLDGGLTVDFALITGIASTPGGIPDASNTQKGITKLSVAPAVPNNPIAVGDNDPRLSSIVGSRRFIYTIQVGDGSDFTVPISPVMSSTNYIVLATLATVAGSHVTLNIPTANRATNQFRVITSGALTVTDTIYFYVVEV